MSATLRDRPVLAGPAGGGVPARRAVARWAWRLLRREWRQQILVLALLTLTVAAAAFSVSGCLQRGVPARPAVRLRQLPAAVRRNQSEDPGGGHRGGAGRHSGPFR